MPIKTGALDHAIRGRLAHALVERRLTAILKDVTGSTNLCDQPLCSACRQRRSAIIGEQQAQWERHHNQRGLVKFAGHC
jgi:hypothetical protein